MPNEIIYPLLAAAGFAMVLMFVTWVVALRVKNLGVVDIAWSCSFWWVAVLFVCWSQGNPMRRTLVLVMVWLWSVRLGSHIAVRVIRNHPREDGRYEMLRAEWGPRLKRKAFWFFQLQAILIAALGTVFLLPCVNARPGITPLEWAGVAVWAVAFLGEGVADEQLKRFKVKPENRGRVCQAGLWNYSRHPNYFFEWLVWVGFFVFAWDSPGGCFTVLCPGVMLFFLLRVTGIPLTEELSLKSKGEAYREYQLSTSAFVPWFKKQNSLKKVCL